MTEDCKNYWKCEIRKIQEGISQLKKEPMKKKQTDDTQRNDDKKRDDDRRNTGVKENERKTRLECQKIIYSIVGKPAKEPSERIPNEIGEIINNGNYDKNLRNKFTNLKNKLLKEIKDKNFGESGSDALSGEKLQITYKNLQNIQNEFENLKSQLPKIQNTKKRPNSEITFDPQDMELYGQLPRQLNQRDGWCTTM